jgi:hypothetical protein
LGKGPESVQTYLDYSVVLISEHSTPLSGGHRVHILVVGSCGKKKVKQTSKPPTCADLDSLDKVKEWQLKPGFRVRELYTGNQNRELVKGVDLLRQIPDVQVGFYIISAGFGLVDENETLPAYDCTFSGMKKKEIKDRAELLGIPSDFKKILSSDSDLVYLALGSDYFLTLGEDWLTSSTFSIIGFHRGLSGKNMLCVPSAHEIVSSFSQNGYKIHGITGFKGDLLRILASYALDTNNPHEELLRWTRKQHLRNLVMKLSGIEF